MMLVTDLAVLDHTDGTVLLIANVAARVGEPAAYDDAVARLDAMAADLTKAVPPGVAVLEPADAPPVHQQPARPASYEDGRRADPRAHPGRRRLPGRARPALRAGDRRRRAGPLPGAAGDQPVAVHVPAALRRPGEPVRRRRLLAGGAGHRHRHVGRRPPAGRHPAARARPRRRTCGWPRACSPTRRSAPST